MQESRKLKRGLKDLSPLFGQVPPSGRAPLLETEKGMECLSIFSPDLPGDSLFLASYFASRLASRERPCTILSLVSAHAQFGPPAGHGLQNEPFGHHVRRRIISWDQLESVAGIRPVALDFSGETVLNSTLFLEFEYAHVPCFEKVIPILDKWIVWLQPSFESLSEAYKMIKATRSANSRLEYFLLLNLPPQAGQGSRLFEQFSEMVSRRLGIHLVWLGSLYLPKGKEPLAVSLDLNPLFPNPAERTDSVEKRMLADFLYDFPGPAVQAGSEESL